LPVMILLFTHGAMELTPEKTAEYGKCSYWSKGFSSDPARHGS